MQYVLVVDDDQDVRQTIAACLTSHGYQVGAAKHAGEATELLKTSPVPGLILLDLLMPEKDGWTFLAELRQDDRYKRVPVVVISAIADRAGRLDEQGATGVLIKPFHPEDLMRVVRAHCT